jgi:protein ImuB
VARVIALVGPGNLGVPVLLDSHRPDSLRLEPLNAAALLSQAKSTDGEEARGTLALRRCRPPRPAQVRLIGGRPVHLRAAGLVGPIVASAGPWRSSGEWWLENRWASDEWDVELADGTLGRLAHDGSAWVLEGIYD